jgi:hypothetical protein
MERTNSRSGGQTPLPSVPEDTRTEVPAFEGDGTSAPPGSFFVANPDSALDASSAEQQTQGDSSSFSNFGGGVSGGLLGAATSAFGWGGFGGGKKEDKSKPTTPKTLAPAWGGLGSVAASVAGSTGGNKWGTGGFGSVAGSVAESTGGNTGWGAATGNDSGSNSGWMLGGGNKSANASNADLLGGAGTTDIPLDAFENSGEPHSHPSWEETHTTEAQEGDVGQNGGHTKEHLTLQTDVSGGPDAEASTTVPTTAVGDSPEEGRDGDAGEGGEEGATEKADDEWPAWGIKQKKGKKAGNASTGAGTPITPVASGGGDDNWATTTTKKKKGKKK